MSHLRRSTALALVLLSLFASAAFAAPRASRSAGSSEGVVASLWTWVTSMVRSASPCSFGFVEKAGSSMDPNGLTSPDDLNVGSTASAGSHMDPDGHK